MDDIKWTCFILLILNGCLSALEVPNTVYDDVIKRVSVDCAVPSDCGLSQAQQNSSTCTSDGVCGASCVSGRTNYPSMEIIYSDDFHLRDCVENTGNQTEDKLNLNFLQDKTCSSVRSFLTNDFTVSFWITATCEQCNFLRVYGTNLQSYDVAINSSDLTINNQTVVNVANWTKITLRITNETTDLFINSEQVLLPLNISLDEDPNIDIGLHSILGISDNLTLSDVRIYKGFLTNREIEDDELLDGDCRCPKDYPIYVNNGTDCSNGTFTQMRYSDPLQYFDINSAVTDRNTSTKWISNETNSIKILVELYDIYQIDNIEILLEDTLPTMFKVKFYSNDIWNSDHGCTSSKMNGSVKFECSIQGKSRKELLKFASDRILITFDGRQSTPGSLKPFIISEISVNGSCACYGNGDTCNRNKNYQAYSCNCVESSFSTGSKCDHCIPNRYQSTDLSCDQTCSCNLVGVVDRNDSCLKNGTCRCNVGYEGHKCDQCSSGYFNSSNKCLSTSENKDKPDLLCIPNVTNRFPTFGPSSGGTKIIIKGGHLCSTPSVTIRNKNLNVSWSNSSYMEVMTVEEDIGKYEMKIIWPNFNMTNLMFEFKPDPSIISPVQSNLKLARGCKFTFKGQNLKSVAQPKLEIQNSTHHCMLGNDKFIECLLPERSWLSPGITYPIKLNLDCESCSQMYNVQISPDPSITGNINMDHTPPFTHYVFIDGSGLDTCDKNDVSVFIGETKCLITSRTSTQIMCTPSSLLTSGEHEIMVRIGQKEFLAGTIHYVPFVQSRYFIYIMVGIGGFILIVISIIATVCFWRRKNRTMNGNGLQTEIPNGTPNEYTSVQMTNMTNGEGVENQAFTSVTDKEDTFDETKAWFLANLPHGLRTRVSELLIQKEDFKFGNICVAKGDQARLIDGMLYQNGQTSKITIKSIRSPLPDNDFPEWVFTSLTECLKLQSLNDVNTLSVCGIGLEKHKFHILYPYMERTLKDHVSNVDSVFSLRHLLDYASQVAEGMLFLSDKQIVIRDLATRTCMIDNNGEVKISDASFSPDFYPTEYMKDKERNRYLPVRWMAPESLQVGFYDSFSDVWSFGVLLWELLTRGCLPFVDTADNKILDLINQDYRLGKPDIVSDDIYALMNQCWESDSQYRPSFQTLVITLGEIIGPETDDDLYVNLEHPRESLYVNSRSSIQRR